MDKFPSILQVSKNTRTVLNKEYYTFVNQKLREEVYISILRNEMYYSLDSFPYYNHPNIKEMVEGITSELQQLGWSTVLAYGNTALFTYYDKKPDSLP